MRKTVLVTGSTGYIGSRLVGALCDRERDWSVIAVGKSNTNIDQRARFIQYDILAHCKDANLYSFLGSPDICVHLAWQDGFNHNAESHIDNLPLHFHFLKSLVDQGITHIAAAGSFREYGSVDGRADAHVLKAPSNFYSLAKTALMDAMNIYLKDKDVCFQWLRPFTVYGDEHLNNSILSKILSWEKEEKETFPFTDGNEEYDYIHVQELAYQIIAVISQREVTGIIDCCSGYPSKLKDKVEEFIKQNDLRIRPEYGAYKTREYDSRIIYGDNAKIKQILAGSK